MPGHSETVHTAHRLSSFAKELRERAEMLDRSATAMQELGIHEMPFPRANAQKVGFESIRTFAETIREVLWEVNHEMAGGTEQGLAIEKVLSGYRSGPRKQREKKTIKAAKPGSKGK